MVHARLGIAEENSGKLVTIVRKEAKKVAEMLAKELLLTDGPPGVGCPVIASVGGAHALIVVAEPSVSGRHDMNRVVALAEHFRVPPLLCINKYDLNAEQTEAIEDYAKTRGIHVVGKVPFDPSFTKAMVQGKTIIEYSPDSEGAKSAAAVWDAIVRWIN
jgi:MinD superfamily P-loop ATPase